MKPCVDCQTHFATEQSVLLETPNAITAVHLTKSRAQVDKVDYLRFDDNKEALVFLADELK